MALHHLPHTAIDLTKWDHCIDRSMNGNLYAYSWYLNLVAPDWEAIIEDDYQAVMPLPVRKKMGIKYLYRPPFCQQLGVFSTGLSDSNQINSFLQAIPSEISYGDISFNIFNKVHELNLDLTRKTNHELDLILPYSSLKANYHKSVRRRLRQSNELKLSYLEGVTSFTFLQYYEENLKEKFTVDENHLQLLRKIITVSQLNRSGKLFGVYNAANELISTAFFIQVKNRSILLASATSEEGRASNGKHFLIDRYIASQAGSNHILDFEGSDIPGVATFNIAFGAVPVYYHHYKLNRLPWYLKILKK